MDFTGIDILAMSDLHIQNNVARCQSLLNDMNISSKIVIIAGDVFESCYPGNRYETLATLFPEKTVIFCLGNHEFFYDTIKNVQALYTKTYAPALYDVHCLDIIGHYDIPSTDIRLLGNVFWYDGSMKDNSFQRLEDYAGHRWLDFTIKSFDFHKEHRICKTKIFDNFDSSKRNVLVTHTVPWKSINLHRSPSEYNAFSGVNDFLKRNRFYVSLSGHTHRRNVGLMHSSGCKCINTGSLGEFGDFVRITI